MEFNLIVGFLLFFIYFAIGGLCGNFVYTYQEYHAIILSRKDWNIKVLIPTVLAVFLWLIVVPVFLLIILKDL